MRVSSKDIVLKRFECFCLYCWIWFLIVCDLWQPDSSEVLNASFIFFDTLLKYPLPVGSPALLHDTSLVDFYGLSNSTL